MADKTMNILQKICAVIGATLIITNCLFPPFIGIHHEIMSGDTVERPIGRHFFRDKHIYEVARAFRQPESLARHYAEDSSTAKLYDSRIDINTLLIEVIIIATSTGALLSLFSSRHRKSGIHQRALESKTEADMS